MRTLSKKAIILTKSLKRMSIVSLFFTGNIIAAIFAALLAFPLLYKHLFLLIPGVAGYSPGDVLNRYFLLIIIATMWRLYPRLKLRTIKLGWLTAYKWKAALGAMGIGGLMISLLFLPKLLWGYGYLEPDALLRLGLLKTLAWYLLGAVTVGLIEETLFRGVALQVFLEDDRTSRLAIPLSALLFSAVHFVDFSEVAGMLLGMNMAEGSTFSLISFYKFVLLFLLGVLLAYTRQRLNTLYAAIGLHVGLVFSLRLYNKIFKPNPGYSTNIFQLGGADLLLVVGILLLSFWLVRLLAGILPPAYNRRYLRC